MCKAFDIWRNVGKRLKGNAYEQEEQVIKEDNRVERYTEK